MTGLEIFFVIGAIAGIACLLWKFGETILNRPSIDLSIALKETNPNTVILKVINNNGRRPVDLIRAGFIFSNGKKVDITHHGYTAGWCFRGRPVDIEIGINVFKNKMNEQGEAIEAVYQADENGRTYSVPIPEDIKKLLSS